MVEEVGPAHDLELVDGYRGACSTSDSARTRRACQAHCSGNGDLDGYALTISGGILRDNEAGEIGGALHVANTSVLVLGGNFSGNSAR